MPTIGQFAKAARAMQSIYSDDRVPYAFEKRIMAQLSGRKVGDITASLANAMWRAAFSCMLVAAITGAIVAFADHSSTELMATDLERTVLAPVDVEDTW